MIPNYDRAARMAYKTLLAMRIDAFPVDPLAILMKCKNTVIRSYVEVMPRFGVCDQYYFRDFVMQGMDAITIRREYGKNTAYELFYDGNVNKRRRRFTLAHELGHIVLRHSAEQKWEEVEADFFASQLLAPRPVLDLFGKAGITVDAPFIARTFGLSKAASEISAKQQIRIEETDLENDIAARFSAIVPNSLKTAV